MGRGMGRGILKQKKALRHQYNNVLYKDYQRLLEENTKMKEDPNGVIAPFLNRFNAIVVQNNRLSALAAAMIDQLGGKVTIEKSIINGFEGHSLTIKIDAPEGVEKFEDANEYIFTYQKVKNEAPKDIVPISECTDPEC